MGLFSAVSIPTHSRRRSSQVRRMSRAFWSVADPIQADGLIG